MQKEPNDPFPVLGWAAGGPPPMLERAEDRRGLTVVAQEGGAVPGAAEGVCGSVGAIRAEPILAGHQGLEDLHAPSVMVTLFLFGQEQGFAST